MHIFCIQTRNVNRITGYLFIIKSGKKDKGRGKNTIEEDSTESPPKGANPPPMDFEDQDVELYVADSETGGATGKGTVTMTGDIGA
ncbi:hypothetical protein DPMN_043375 [Dreissena polymorpha]|uniref:Uncharacterized protein n=1 Tax=Dreissena polymorpha TaxID=45954 RepID=A0A9D4D0W0_DREPO|nr:hypothetical protein DPMN_043375 [Dreissena polymorpha]